MNRNRHRFWTLLGAVLVMTIMVVAALVDSGAAGKIIGYWFLIGGDAGEPFFDQECPANAYNPDRREYLVVWHNKRTVYPDIQAQRISIHGELVGGPFYIDGGPDGKRLNPDVVYNPSHNEYLVVWEEELNNGHTEIISQRVSDVGLLIGEESPVYTGLANKTYKRPAVSYASTSDQYMVVWEVWPTASHTIIEGQVLTGTGEPDGSIISINSWTLGNAGGNPDIAYNRSRNEYLVTWEDAFGVCGRIFTADGVLLGSTLYIGTQSSADYSASVIGIPTMPNFGMYLVTWNRLFAPGDHDIYGRVVQGNGSLSSEMPISTSLADDTQPSVAWNENGSLGYIVWSRVTDVPSGKQDVIGMTFDPLGNLGAEESYLGYGYFSEHPVVTAGPHSDFLVAWSAILYSINYDIYGQIWGERYYTYVPIMTR